MAKFQYYTAEALDKLKAELHYLKITGRSDMAKQIAEARDKGDLSENAEYDAAKEKQGFIEGRIQELEGKLSAAQIIDPASLDVNGRVVFGATVDLEDLEDGTKLTYQIVGDDEADIAVNKISISSPIARALIGKEEGDVVSVQAPGGNREVEILAVRYI
jgi:transcription elongation factor GreA